MAQGVVFIYRYEIKYKLVGVAETYSEFTSNRKLALKICDQLAEEGAVQIQLITYERYGWQ